MVKLGTADEFSEYGKDAYMKFREDLNGLMMNHTDIWGLDPEKGAEILGGMIAAMSIGTTQCYGSLLTSAELNRDEIIKLFNSNSEIMADAAIKMAKKCNDAMEEE